MNIKVKQSKKIKERKVKDSIVIWDMSILNIIIQFPYYFITENPIIFSL